MSAQLKSTPFAALGAAASRLDRDSATELLKRHLPQVVTTLAVIALAWQAAQLTWLVWNALKPATVLPVPAPVAAAVNQSNNINPQMIANAHVFGAPSAAGTADPNALPQAQVNLILAGTMALNDPAAGFAIIGDSAASAKFYRVGATINGVARLHSVYTDRVVIERNGALETLVLPRGKPSMAPAPMAQGFSQAPANFGENLRRLANNPETLSNLLRAQPVFVSGTLKGYRVYPGRERQQFAKAGLQPGDLVTAVNGTALDDPSRGNDILNTLAASTNAVVVVERNGVNQQINLDMTQLSLPEPEPAAAGPRPGSASGFGTPGAGPQPAPSPSSSL